MRNHMRRILSIALVLVLTLGLLPASFALGSGSGRADYPLLDNASEILEADVFARITEVEETAACPMGGRGRLTEKDYGKLIPAIKQAIIQSETYVPGTLHANGNFLKWETTTGMPCCYSPRLRAKLNNPSLASDDEKTVAAQKELEALCEELTSTRGGSPSAIKIGLIQPFWDSNTYCFLDDARMLSGPTFKSTWEDLYNTMSGGKMRYTMTNATVSNIAKTIEECGLVIFDSHGSTDYEGPDGEDFTSRANCSYIVITSKTGITANDCKAKTGPYDTYYDFYDQGNGTYLVSGTCITNHMTNKAPHSMVYLNTCFSMATDGLCKPLRNKGVEAVWGYSQSVYTLGDMIYLKAIMNDIKDGFTLKSAVARAKSSYGKWDPFVQGDHLTEAQARANHIAFPIAVSSEDAYPGHGNVDKVQTVKSTWTLTPSCSCPTIKLKTIGTLPYGAPYNIEGMVISPNKLNLVTGTIFSGDQVVQTFPVQPNNDYLNLVSSDINHNLKFGDLPAGTYRLEIEAENDNGTTWSSVQFTVKKEYPVITLNAINPVICGSTEHPISGKITSGSKLKSVTGQILSGGAVRQTYPMTVNDTTVYLSSSAINANLDFSKLPIGTYTLKIIAINASGSSTQTITFNVIATPTNGHPAPTVVEYYPACSASCTTIKSGLSNIGVDNTLNHRKLIAAANRAVEPLFKGYSGTAAQNTRMLAMLKQGILINPDVSAFYPPCEDSYTGIANALKSIGIDGSYAFRKTIAAANPSEPLFQNYSGTAAQNTRMLEMLKQGILRKP